MNKPKEYTVYALMRPDTFEFFYVGVTSKHFKTRFDGHMKDAQSNYKWATTSKPIMAELLELGLEPMVIPLDRITVCEKGYVDDLERFWINHVWSTGHPIQNRRGLQHDERPIFLDLIKRLHEAIVNGLDYEGYRRSEIIYAAKLLGNYWQREADALRAKST